MNDNLTKRVSSGLIWTYAERITAQVITLIVTIVLARLIAPEEYGIIAIVTIFITIANAFVVSGFGNSLIQKKDADDTDFSTVFYFSIVFSLLIYFIVFFTAPYLASFYEAPILVSVTRIMALRLPIAAINSVQLAYISKRMEFKKFFFSTLGGTVVSAFLGIGLAYVGFGVWALVIQYLSNVTINTIVLFFTAGWRPRLLFSWQRMKGLFAYGWKIMIVGVMTTLYSSLRTLIIGKKYTTTELAYSNKGEQFPSTIAMNINSSISKVLFPVLANNQEDLGKLKKIVRRSICVGNYILIPLLCGFAVVAEPFVRVVLTDKWIGCVPYLQIMCIVYSLQPIQTASLQAVKALGKSTLYLGIDIVKKVFGLIVLFVTVVFFDGVLIIVIGALVVEVFSVLINIPVNKKLFGYTYWEQLQDVIKPVTLTMIMCICSYSITSLNLHYLHTLVLQIIFGTIVYIGISIVAKDESYVYISNIAKSYLSILSMHIRNNRRKQK